MRERRSKWGAFAVLIAGLLAACDQNNSYKPPPPPHVAVALPVQRNVTHFLEITGSVAAFNTVDLVARVPGFLQEIKYQDGAVVKRGTLLFTIEPQSYKLKLEQAQAAEAGAQASVLQTDNEYKRQATLGSKQFAAQSVVDQSLAARDAARANLQQAQVNTKLAQINYDYTQVTAPMDGIVTTHLVSVGELVGTTPTQLATIVQFDPIYVNFNISEQDVLRIRASMARRGVTASDLRQLPIEVGLQSENGYPHTGAFDYAAPIVNPSTGTLPVRAIFQNPNRALLPGNFVRVRVPLEQMDNALLVPATAIGNDQGGRYVLVVNADNVVEQRKVAVGDPVDDLRVIENGLRADDGVVVGGILRAVPGQKVEVETAAAAKSGAN
jgi:RND family efflux transporter MFP subunit